MIQKYADKHYIDSGYFESDEETSNNSEKIVTVRKDHQCMGLETPEHTIKKGQKAVKETAIHCDSGWVSCYVCLPCIDIWLEEIGEPLERFNQEALKRKGKTK